MTFGILLSAEDSVQTGIVLVNSLTLYISIMMVVGTHGIRSIYQFGLQLSSMLEGRLKSGSWDSLNEINNL
jgi:hypothetical protein